MDKMDIEILMLDGCTEKEAIKHLKEGTTIYDWRDKNAYINNCIGGLMDHDEILKCWECMPEVEYKNVRYKIDYIL